MEKPYGIILKVISPMENSIYGSLNIIVNKKPRLHVCNQGIN